MGKYSITRVCSLENPDEPMYGIEFTDGVVMNILEVSEEDVSYEVTVMQSSINKFDSVPLSELSGFTVSECRFVQSEEYQDRAEFIESVV